MGVMNNVRTRDELRAVIHESGLRYEECDRLSVSSDWAQCLSDDAVTVLSQ